MLLSWIIVSVSFNEEIGSLVVFFEFLFLFFFFFLFFADLFLDGVVVEEIIETWSPGHTGWCDLFVV